MKKGFTLAEVLITLAIIGVVAALTIPVIITNAREQGNITAFKKAVSVLNSAISLTNVNDSSGPNASTSAKNLMDILEGNMSVIAKNSNDCTPAALPANNAGLDNTNGSAACWFTTADGIQFILPTTDSIADSSSNTASPKASSAQAGCYVNGTKVTSAACTSAEAGGVSVAENDVLPTAYYACSAANPCLLVVDINGTNAPNRFTSNFNTNSISGKVSDRFVISVTADDAYATTTFDQAVMAK